MTEVATMIPVVRAAGKEMIIVWAKQRQEMRIREHLRALGMSIQIVSRVGPLGDIPGYIDCRAKWEMFTNQVEDAAQHTKQMVADIRQGTTPAMVAPKQEETRITNDKELVKHIDEHVKKVSKWRKTAEKAAAVMRRVQENTVSTVREMVYQQNRQANIINDHTAKLYLITGYLAEKDEDFMKKMEVGESEFQAEHGQDYILEDLQFAEHVDGSALDERIVIEEIDDSMEDGKKVKAIEDSSTSRDEQSRSDTRKRQKNEETEAETDYDKAA